MKKYLLLFIPLLFFAKNAFASDLIFSQTTENTTVQNTNNSSDTAINIYTEAMLNIGSISDITLKFKANTSVPQSGRINKQSVNASLPPGDKVNGSCFAISTTSDYKTSYFITTEFPDDYWQLTVDLFSSSNCGTGQIATNSADFKMTFDGINSRITNTSTYILNGGTAEPSFTPYLIINGSAQSDSILEITDPISGATRAIGSQNISGTCPVNGQLRLYLHNSNDPLSYKNDNSSYDIDCTNNEWSGTYNVIKGLQNIVINDKNWINDNEPLDLEGDNNFQFTSAVLGVDGGDNNWRLESIYPPCEHNPYCDTLQPSTDWIFRWRYLYPNSIPRSEINFKLVECTAGQFVTCNTTILENDLETLDPDPRGFLDTAEGDITVEENVEHYFKVSLIWNSSEVYALTFVTVGKTGSGTHPALPPGSAIQDCGIYTFLCTLFIPNSDDWYSITNGLTENVKNKIPFGYFFALQDKLESNNVNSSSISQNVAFTINNQNVNIPIDISGNTFVSNLGDTIRPIANWILWIGLLIFAYQRVITKS